MCQWGIEPSTQPKHLWFLMATPTSYTWVPAVCIRVWIPNSTLGLVSPCAKAQKRRVNRTAVIFEPLVAFFMAGIMSTGIKFTFNHDWGDQSTVYHWSCCMQTGTIAYTCYPGWSILIFACNTIGNLDKLLVFRLNPYIYIFSDLDILHTGWTSPSRKGIKQAIYPRTWFTDWGPKIQATHEFVHKYEGATPVPKSSLIVCTEKTPWPFVDKSCLLLLYCFLLVALATSNHRQSFW